MYKELEMPEMPENLLLKEDSIGLIVCYKEEDSGELSLGTINGYAVASNSKDGTIEKMLTIRTGYCPDLPVNAELKYRELKGLYELEFLDNGDILLAKKNKEFFDFLDYKKVIEKINSTSLAIDNLFTHQNNTFTKIPKYVENYVKKGLLVKIDTNEKLVIFSLNDTYFHISFDFDFVLNVKNTNDIVTEITSELMEFYND